MNSRRMVLAGVLAVAVVGCGGGGGGDSPTAPQAQLTIDQVEARSFNLVNQERGNDEVGPLRHNAAAAAVARTHSEAMRDQGFFGHVAPQGGNLRQRLRAGNVAFQGAGENIVQVNHPTDPAGLGHDELMRSAEHRSNILDDSFDSVGVGVARRGDTFWITQIFIVD